MLGDGFAIGTTISDNSSILFWGLLIFNLIIYAIVLTNNREYFRTLFSTVVFNRYLLYNSQEVMKMENIRSRLLSFTYFTSLAACALRFISGDDLSIVLAALVLLGGTLLKFSVMWGLGFISKTKDGIIEHQLNHQIYFQTSSLLLSVVLIFTFALDNEQSFIVLWVILGILILGLVIREIQSLIRAVTAKVSVLYIILYLCTLEIVPLLVILRVFTSNEAVLS
ncbi:MAG: DUF4271 domain-containing protein [Crocinitomicaceae bacterium]|nr:DUF4271 domain-containing protein [Crocinitomicaceae bacterium]